MYSHKKKQPKDRIIQDACGAIEDYLRESEQKDTNKKYIDLPYNNYKITSLKGIFQRPNLKEDNFIDVIKEYNNTYISTGNLFNDMDIAFKPNISKSFNSLNLKEKEESSQNNEKFEILEDGSICIKNTTGMISTSLGEKYLELKNSNSDININKDIDQDILTNSKLLIINNVKCLDDDICNNEKENEFINNSSYNSNNLIKNRNNIFEINNDIDENNDDDNDNYKFKSHLKNCKSLNNIYRDNNFVYFSSSKKNKIKSKDSNNKANISTNVKKKKFIVKAQTKNRNNAFDKKSNKENVKKNNTNYFLKEIKINYNNNELDSKRTLFGDNFKDEDEIINQWKYLSNRFIKEYNKKLLSTNIQIITQNLKIEKILEAKNNQKIDKNNNIIYDENNNYFGSFKEQYNNIEQDNIAQSINDIAFNNNRNESCDFDFIPENTDISHILQPPIGNFNKKYENFFEEIDSISEKKIKNINKYRVDIESINEEMNESYEEQELSDKKKYVKHNKIQINNPMKDTIKINLDLNKLISNFNNIDNIYSKIINSNNKNKNNSRELLCISPISSNSNTIKYPKGDKYYKNSKYSPCPSIVDSEDISVSRETETEMSDEEILLDKNGKIAKNIYNNSLIKNYLSYKIEKNNNNIKLIFGDNNNKYNYNRPSINIKSYKKILKMIFYKKRKPITKNSYEELLLMIINNLSIFKREYYLRKSHKEYNAQEKEALKNNCIQVDKRINELEEIIKEMKYYYIYGLIENKLIKDKLTKKRFVKNLKIGEKRNKIKRKYKEAIYILNNKINDRELNMKYYQKMIDTLKKYEKIDEIEINEIKTNISKIILI